MNILMGRYRCLFAIFIFLLAYISLYPFYQYVFDDDGVGYLMIARRLAAGDWYNAINGCWSPLHPWLAAPLIKAGMNEFLAFRMLNGAIGAGILFFMHRLLKKMSLAIALQAAVLLVSIPVILSFCYYEVGADVLVCLLLLIYADIVTTPGFSEKPRLNLLAGIVGCLAYLAKTYALPFFLVHFTIVQLVYYRKAPPASRKRSLLRNLLLGCGACLLLTAPWVYVLYHKYHFITWGYAGMLNFTWRLTPPAERVHAIFMRPVNATSPAGWEDPLSFTTGRIYHSFSSWPVFLKQLKLFFHNCKEAIRYFNELSFFGMALIAGLMIYLFKRYSVMPLILLITIVLLPAGYLPVYIETRYIWAAGLLMLITGAWLLQEIFRQMSLAKWQRAVGWGIFFVSFLLYPADRLQDHWLVHKDVFDMAQTFRRYGVSGKFVGLNHQSEMERIAYLSGTQYYGTSFKYSDGEILAAARQEGIPRLVYIYDDLRDAAAFKKTLLYTSGDRQIEVPGENLIIVELSSVQ